MSVLSLLVIIPWIFLDTSPGSAPVQAGIVTLVGMLLHLLILLWILRWIRRTKRKYIVYRETYIFSGIILFIFGLIMLDGATDFIDQLRIASVGMFVCIFSDIMAAVVFFVALFYLKLKKKD